MCQLSQVPVIALQQTLLIMVHIYEFTNKHIIMLLITTFFFLNCQYIKKNTGIMLQKNIFFSIEAASPISTLSTICGNENQHYFCIPNQPPAGNLTVLQNS